MKHIFLFIFVLISAEVLAGDKMSLARRMGREFKAEWIEDIKQDIKDNDLDELLTRELKEEELTKLKCPKYNSFTEEDRLKFWVLFMAGIAASESAFDPKCFYEEPGTHDSFGLLQIDGPNSRAHGCVKRDGTKPSGGKEGKEEGKDMYDPEINLRCGMYIVRNQLSRSSELFYKGSYWAVLRVGRKGHERFLRFIHQNINQIPACQ
jgi:hypothetical protein